MSLLEYISACTNRYAHKDWVVESPCLDREGNVTTKPILKHVHVSEKEDLLPGARHRYRAQPGHEVPVCDRWFLLA
jgi:hypothetical protein